MKAWEHGQDDWTRFAPGQGINRLALHAVDDRTNLSYLRELKAFFVDVVRLDARWATREGFDQTLAQYVSHLCYLETSQPQKGKNLLSAVAHFFP